MPEAAQSVLTAEEKRLEEPRARKRILLFQGRQMPVTRRDSIETEKPEWLIQMETVLEELNEGVVMADHRNRILFANSRFVEMTGIPRQDLIGFGISPFYSSQEWDFVMQQVDVAFRAGRNRYAFVLPRKAGGRLPVIISSRTLQNSGSQFRIVTFTDISEQVRAEEELRSANVKLQERQMEIEEDLRLAARVQRSLAPKPLVSDTISVDAFYRPAHSIGGDFALVNSLDHEHLSLLVGDVSGHGIGSALVANRIDFAFEISSMTCTMCTMYTTAVKIYLRSFLELIHPHKPWSCFFFMKPGCLPPAQ